MPVGVLMRLEAVDTLPNKRAVARWQPMDFVVEPSAFCQ